MLKNVLHNGLYKLAVIGQSIKCTTLIGWYSNLSPHIWYISPHMWQMLL